MNREIQTEIEQIVGRLREIQDSRKLSDRQLCSEYPDLGSTKTWRQRLLAGKWEELNADRVLQRLRRVATVLDGGTPDEVFYPELQFSREMAARLGKLERQTNDRRILVCLAPNGTGKSAFARWAVAQSRARRCYVRIRPAWREKLLHISNGMCMALGREGKTSNVAEAEDQLISLLSGQSKTLFIDQAHEGGVKLLHLLRALVDETPSRFVYLAYDTTFRRVLAANTDALAESQAFLGRCLKPVFDLYRAGTAQKDVELFLVKLAGMNPGTAASVAARVLPVLRAHTNARLLIDAVEKARAAADEQDPDPETVVQAVSELAGEERRATKEEEEA